MDKVDHPFTDWIDDDDEEEVEYEPEKKFELKSQYLNGNSNFKGM